MLCLGDLSPSPQRSFSTSSTMDAYSILKWAAPYLLSLFALLIFIEQITYLKKKSFIPGPAFVLPFVGNAFSLIRNPVRFWNFQSSYAATSPLRLSANWIIGKFVVYIGDSELCHKVLANVRPDGFHLLGYPFGKELFGEINMIYMFGQDHKDIRRSFAPNFTLKALSIYTSIQQRVILKYLVSWEKMSSDPHKSKPQPISLRQFVRNMNLETSQTIFTGTYLSQQEKERFSYDYNLFNVGLLKLPINLPGFAYRNARVARVRLAKTLSVCAEKSKAKILHGKEPDCLTDFLIQEILREEQKAARGDPPPPYSSNQDVGNHLLDFLFAAQDASTSSLLWSVILLEAHPDILARVREEVSQIWRLESQMPITCEHLQEMKYTQAVAREVLRYRPPAPMLPHIAAADFALTENFTIHKGTLVFPSLFDSSFQGFTEADRFDPDRFLELRGEDKMFKRNFLVFGAGAHQCVGQRYAVNHLVLFIAMFVTLMNFKRHRTDGCDEIVYVPTTSPKDDCTVYLSKRCTKYPSY
ncbi:hypothetical protein Droror1_Dr00022809 [Drosera rotundifolia]